MSIGPQSLVTAQLQDCMRFALACSAPSGPVPAVMVSDASDQENWGVWESAGLQDREQGHRVQERHPHCMQAAREQHRKQAMPSSITTDC